MSKKVSFNITLAGSFGVGKSTIFSYLKKERTAETDHVLTGVSSRGRDKWTHYAYVNGICVTVTLWDTGEMEKHGIKNMTKSYFAQCNGMILVYDRSNTDTLYELKNWMSEANSSCCTSGVLFSMWGNDRGGTCDVSEENATFFATEYGIPLDMVFRISTTPPYKNLKESYQSFIKELCRRRCILPMSRPKNLQESILSTSYTASGRVRVLRQQRTTINGPSPAHARMLDSGTYAGSLTHFSTSPSHFSESINLVTSLEGRTEPKKTNCSC